MLSYIYAATPPPAWHLQGRQATKRQASFSGEKNLRESFNDWGGGGGCHKNIPVFGGDGMKIAPPGDLYDQPPGEMSWIRGKLSDHVGDM